MYKGESPPALQLPSRVSPGSSYACADSYTPSTTHISVPRFTAMGSRMHTHL